MQVGVIGGGQLARMMIPPAVNLGLDIKVLAEVANSSAALTATAVGDYKDIETVLAFAADCDVITFDHEHVPQPVLSALIDANISVQPGAFALKLAQNKIWMRQQLTKLGLPMPDWAAVQNAAELTQFLESQGGRCVVKTAIGGYDGKGVRVVTDPSQVSDWFAELGGQPGTDGVQPALLAEEAVPFVRELAQLSARSVTGEFVAWPLVETVQKNGVCAEVYAPAPGSSPDQLAEAQRIAREVAAGIGVTGVLAVELFEHPDGRLLINELAMRPHNSGHWTQEGAITSQFEQHLRAVLGLPLGETGMRAPVAVMFNILGGPKSDSLSDRLAAGLEDGEAKVHLYGKAARPGRKVGHINLLGNDLDQTKARAARILAKFL